MSETAIESIRRSTRVMLLFTELTAVLPIFFLLQERRPWAVLGLLMAGVVAIIVIRVRGTLLRLRGLWEPYSYARVYGLVAAAMGIAVLAAVTGSQTGVFTAILVGITASEFFVARPLGVASRHVGIVVALQSAAFWIVVVSTGHGDMVGPTLIGTIIMTSGLAYSVGLTYRWWEGVLKLEQARRDAAELATTRERLRLAEDLHDILGHALEVVSLKSELAVRLTDPEKSKAEMIEVQRLARNALRDVRALAHGNRRTDFGTELTGARGLLDSAGIACDFDADPTALTTSERDLFGRVLREAMTNALRHADPRSCTVSLAVTPDQATLRIVNDGVAPLQRDGEGSGLAGLARRVEASGGSFTARAVEPASFEVIASLPR
nr:histidine kinase [Kibdelosporangium sp. MJ126-NF4]CEL15151.1 Putative two-component system sensor kinase [Kibdelosporangium sp. MJ126-NF4]